MSASHILGKLGESAKEFVIEICGSERADIMRARVAHDGDWGSAMRAVDREEEGEDEEGRRG